MEIKNKLHKEFLNACKRFKIEQLQEEQLLKLLPISNWNEISEEVEKSNLILSHKFLNIFLLKAIEDKPDAEIWDKIIALHFFDVIYHPYKKTWSVFIMKNQNEEFISARHLKMKLENSVKLLNVPIIVMTKASDFIVWIMLVEKKKKTKQYLVPTYCAFSGDTKYLFVSRNSIPEKVEKVLINTFQCHSLKYCDLFGKNIHGLMTLLRHKSSSSSLSIERQAKKKFKPDVVRSNNGNDYTLEKQAKAYIRSLFDEEPQLQTLSIKAKGFQLSASEDNSEHLKVDAGLILKSRNILRFLESLAGMGILKMPAMEYLIKFPTSGKNILKCVVEK